VLFGHARVGMTKLFGDYAVQPGQDQACRFISRSASYPRFHTRYARRADGWHARANQWQQITKPGAKAALTVRPQRQFGHNATRGALRGAFHRGQMTCGGRRAMPISYSDDYFVVTKRGGQQGEWAWEIQRRSKPIGVRLNGDGFNSEFAANLAGEKALRELLDGLAQEKTNE